ncbi:MAG: hypothetical protein U1F77_00370 [Kiritimatiellia bacterium]
MPADAVGGEDVGRAGGEGAEAPAWALLVRASCRKAPPAPGRPAPLQRAPPRRHQHADQSGDDRQHDQQFQQGEGGPGRG